MRRARIVFGNSDGFDSFCRIATLHGPISVGVGGSTGGRRTPGAGDLIYVEGVAQDRIRDRME